jgi:hypothetical protein
MSVMKRVLVLQYYSLNISIVKRGDSAVKFSQYFINETPSDSAVEIYISVMEHTALLQ